MNQKLCPCGSKKASCDCCLPFLLGKKLPDTPEELMRSRYTAFTQSNTNYLKITAKGKAFKTFNEKQTKQFCQSVSWHNLQILNSSLSPTEDIGYVEFIATFFQDEKEHRIHEISFFEKIKNRWFYTDGKHVL